MAYAVSLEPVPAITGTLPATVSTQNFIASLCSSSDRVLASPVVPQTTIASKIRCLKPTRKILRWKYWNMPQRMIVGCCCHWTKAWPRFLNAMQCVKTRTLQKSKKTMSLLMQENRRPNVIRRRFGMRQRLFGMEPLVWRNGCQRGRMVRLHWRVQSRNRRVPASWKVLSEGAIQSPHWRPVVSKAILHMCRRGAGRS